MRMSELDAGAAVADAEVGAFLVCRSVRGLVLVARAPGSH